MDPSNRFGTTTTYSLMRLEYGAVLVASLVALVLHYREVDWWHFAALFLVIDLIGYIPGAIVYRTRGGLVPKLYYVLYNTMHSLTTWMVLLALWGLVWGAEWAFLAVPIHLAGDRSLFGNMVKSFHVSYEPTLHPAFREFERALARPAA